MSGEGAEVMPDVTAIEADLHAVALTGRSASLALLWACVHHASRLLTALKASRAREAALTAKVARVEALAEEWDARRVGRLVYPAISGDALRAALADDDHTGRDQ